MNTEPQTISGHELTVLEPAPPPSEEQAPKREHRSHGKIARLPRILRDRLNTMLDDGVPYNLIIEKLEQSTDPPLPYTPR